VTNVEQLQAQYDALRQELKGLREDVRALAGKLESVIRLEGDLQRHADLAARIGRQVDEHEKRLRYMENSLPTTREKLRGQANSWERLIWLGGMIIAAISGAVASGGMMP